MKKSNTLVHVKWRMVTRTHLKRLNPLESLPWLPQICRTQANWFLVLGLTLMLIGLTSGCRPSGSGDSSPHGLVHANSPEDHEERWSWLLMSTVENYLKVGHRNPKWDDAATNALMGFAGTIMGGQWLEDHHMDDVVNLVQEAVDAGCDDPFIQYLFLRNNLQDQLSATENADKWREVAVAMNRSKYHPVRRYYALMRAYQASWKRQPIDKQAQTDLFRAAWRALGQFLINSRVPAEEVHNACSSWMDALGSRNVNEFFEGQVISHVQRSWSNTVPGQLVLAKFYLKYGWNARGGGLASEVNEDQWTIFFDRVRQAETILTNLWTHFPDESRVFPIMIDVAKALQYERPAMEQWFDRAMTISTNNYHACTRKLIYLEPKWYGSAQDMIEFGRQCVESTEWGGQVPLILVDAHETLSRYEPDPTKREEYWKSASIRMDIRRSFNKFFSLHPEAVGWRHNYALYAYRCQDWSTFLDQVDLFQEINYEYFGGKETFDGMLARAKAAR